MTSSNPSRLHVSEPWALAEDAFRILVERSPHDLRELKSAFAFAVRERADLEVVDGVARIPVQGLLTARSWWPGDSASYEWIAARFEEALERKDVRAIVLVVDSPGGQVAGADQVSRLIFGSRASKPSASVVLGQASSAAYWIASAAGEVIAGRSSLLGSIGVMWTFIDFSRMNETLGIQEIDIVSSQSPDKNLSPTTESGRARIQTTVDQLAGIFVADVARNRGVTEPTVVSDFGAGWVLVGEQAVAAGLADRLGALEEIADRLSGAEANPLVEAGAALDWDYVLSQAALADSPAYLLGMLDRMREDGAPALEGAKALLVAREHDRASLQRAIDAEAHATGLRRRS